MAFQLGATLLDARNGHALHLRNLGANLIENCIKTAQLDSSQHKSLRDQFWSLLFCQPGAFDSCNERVLLKEKVAQCMALLASKLWLRPEDDPLQWNDFFELGLLEGVLKAQVSASVDPNEHLRRQEFALLTISHLINLIRAPSEKATGPIWITEDRRLQLLSGLEIVIPPFCEWLFQNYPAAVAANVSSNVLNAAIKCFRSICTWMNNLNIEGFQSFLSSSMSLLLLKDDDEDLVLNVLDTLQSCFALKSFTPAEHKILEFFLISLFPQICQLLQKYQSDKDEESYQKTKILVQCLMSIGNRYICNVKNPLTLKTNFDSVFNLFLSLSQIPSLTIYLDLLEFLTNILKCAALHEKVQLTPHLPNIFMLIATKMTRNYNEERRSLCNEIDFEDSSEFKEFWGIAKTRSGDLLKLLTCKYPEKLLEFSYNALGSFLQSQNTSAAKQWEGLLFIEEAISKGLQDLPDSSSKLHSLCLLHLQLYTLHGPIPTDLAVLERWIAGVKAFTALQGSACPPEDFRRSVEVLFNLAISTERPEQIRTFAAMSILKLADANVSLFLPLLEPLLHAVSPLISASSGSWERRLFSELILIFMAQPGLAPEKQMSLFSAVADPLVDLLKNAKGALLAASDPVLALMKRIGFDELNANVTISVEARKFTSDLNLLLSTLQILFKRTAPLVQSQPHSPIVLTCLQVLDELVGFLMLMIQCTHRMGTPAIWRLYYNSDSQYLAIYPKMQEFLENGNNENTTGSSDNLSTVNCSTSALVHIAGWSRHYRQTCYTVLGSAAASFANHFYALPHLAERFMTQPLSALESLNLADWNLLIKLLLRPVLQSAPRELIPTLVGGSLTGLLVLLSGKLESEWAAVAAANSSTKPATGAALTAEMSRESKCNALSCGFISFLCDLLGVPTIEAMKCVSLLHALEQDNLLPKLVQDSETLPATWLFAKASPELIISLTEFVGKAMTSWPRSVGVFGKLANLLIRLTSGVMGRSDFPNRALYLSQSSNIALSCWSSPTWTDHQNLLLALLVEQFKWSFLLAATEKHTGPMLFANNDTANFLKSCKVTDLTILETQLRTLFAIPSQDLISLRTTILTTETPKTQRNALRSLLQKYTKATPPAVQIDLKQKEFSGRLTEMKKRFVSSKNVEETENFDSLLSDLFNA